METENNSSNSRFIRTNLLDEDAAAALSAFRRRNKILLLVLLFLAVLLAVVVAVLITYFVHTSDVFSQQSEQNQPVIRLSADFGIEVFCRGSSDKQSCMRTLARNVNSTSNVNPSQIFTYSLQTAATELEDFVSFLSNVTDRNKSPLNFVDTCSNSSIEALKQIADTLAAMRVTQSVLTLGKDQRREMVSWMDAAAGNLDSCLSELEKAKAEATAAVREAMATAREVKEYVGTGATFLLTYGVVFAAVENRVIFVEDHRGMDIETLYGIAMVGLQLLYVAFLFWWLFRIR